MALPDSQDRQENEAFSPSPPPNEPVFNIPSIIIIVLALLAAIHAARVYLLSTRENLELIFQFAFIPARYTNVQIAEIFPMAAYWSPISYGFLHADWTHLLINGFWLLAFGGVVAKRIGWLSFVLLFVAGSMGGAVLHYATNIGSVSPMIGASASVSACIGAAVRFAFPAGGRFAMDASNLPRQSFVEAFSNKQVLVFVGIWFAINLIVGVGLVDIDGSGSSVAWQAHIGGFLAGLLLFDFFDKPKL